MTVFGTSANTRGTYDRTGWDILGYKPMDDSERYLESSVPIDRPNGNPDRYCGGQTCFEPIKED